jgi:hypothetical protein
MEETSAADTATSARVSLPAAVRDRAVRLGRVVRAAVARDPVFVAVFAALWICALVPIWRPRFLPLLDLPNHLDAIAIWHRYHDESWGYSKFYNLNLIPLPYWGYFLPVHLLAYVMPVEVANKVYLSAYALTLPLSAAVLARQMGRSYWLSLFAFPLIFNLNFSYGFITFCVGVVVLTFALVVLDRFLEAPTRRRAIALAVLSLALYSTHVLPWMFFGIASVVLVFCHGLSARRIALAFALELPSLILAIYGFRAAANGTTAVQPGPFAYDAKKEELLSLLQGVPMRLVAGWPANGAYWVVVVLTLAWFAILVTARTDAQDTEARKSGFAYRLELVVMLAGACYLFLPWHLFKPVDLWMIGGRFVTIVALYGALVPHGPLVGRRRLLLIPVILASIYYPLALSKKWVEFDRRAASFRRLMRHVDRGSSTLTLVLGDGTDISVDANAVPYLQFHAYAQYLGGGYDPWALDTGFPHTRKPDTGLPAPRWKHYETFTFDQHGLYYDYIITKGEWTDHAIFGPDDAGRAPLVATDGDWRLYSVRRQ